jgi:uncharacterized membrane protein YdbT with pleckstrin-like domain
VDPEAGEEVFFSGHPSWRSLWAHLLRWLLGAIVVGAVAGVVSRLTEHHWRVWWIVAAIVIVGLIGAVIGQVRRIATTYAITDRRLVIEQGIFSRDVHQTRLERIQNVNTSQSLLERMLRIGDVDFDTAAEAEFQFAFNGVAEPKQIVRTVDRAVHAMRGDAEPPTSGV